MQKAEFQPYRYVWTGLDHSLFSYIENQHAGNYIVTVYDSLNCSQTMNITIEGQPYPVANFTLAPQRTFLDNALITFSNHSTNYTSSVWDFGDGTNSIEISPFHRYQVLGHFPVMLMVQSDNLCYDTLVKFVDIVEDFFIYVPNAFSPNSDGINDGFGPIMKGASEKGILFEIFSRWGDLVFYSNDVHKFWDGKSVSNIDYPIGSYVYKLIVLDLCDIPHQYSGTVVIIK